MEETNHKFVLSLGVLFCVLLCPLNTTSISLGKCPKMQVQQNFDLARYLGRWYGQASFNLDSHALCQEILYYFKAPNGLLERSLLLLNNESWVNADITAQLDDPNRKEGRLSITTLSKEKGNIKPYLILETDYQTYSVVYSCEETSLFTHRYKVLFLSRYPDAYTFSTGMQYIDNTNRVLREHGILSSVMVKMTRNGKQCYF